jgi:hypothetical protein
MRQRSAEPSEECCAAATARDTQRRNLAAGDDGGLDNDDESPGHRPGAMQGALYVSSLVLLRRDRCVVGRGRGRGDASHSSATEIVADHLQRFGTFSVVTALGSSTVVDRVVEMAGVPERRRSPGCATVVQDRILVFVLVVGRVGLEPTTQGL